MTLHMGTYAHPLAEKAWKISDDEHCHIVWADHGMQARRLGAQGLERDFDEVECERYPVLDGFHGDLLGWMLEAGWSFECQECYRMCYGGTPECIRDEHDNIFCSEEHRAKFQDEWDRKRAMKAAFQKFAEVKYFGMEPRVQYVNVAGDALVDLRRPPPDDRLVVRFISRAELGA
jgi:hypothetical protein